MDKGRLPEKFKLLKPDQQVAFLKNLELTIALGTRALVLANLNQNDADDFKKMTPRPGDDEVLVFGRKRIKDFDIKLGVLLDEIYRKAAVAI